MKRLVGIVTAGLILCVTPAVAYGQLFGSVVPNAAIGPGVRITGDYSRGLNDESGETNFFGARAGVGLPGFSFWGGFGSVKNGDSEVTFGGGVAIKVVKGPLVPVEPQFVQVGKAGDGTPGLSADPTTSSCRRAIVSSHIRIGERSAE